MNLFYRVMIHSGFYLSFIVLYLASIVAIIYIDSVYIGFFDRHAGLSGFPDFYSMAIVFFVLIPIILIIWALIYYYLLAKITRKRMLILFNSRKDSNEIAKERGINQDECVCFTLFAFDPFKYFDFPQKTLSEGEPTQNPSRFYWSFMKIFLY